MLKNNIEYIYTKISTLLYKQTIFKEFKIGPGVYVVNKNIHKLCDSVGFLLNNSRYVHIGDQFFYYPIIQSIQNSNLKVSVAPTSPMRSYFEKSGISVTSPADVLKSDIVICPVWMYSKIKKLLGKSKTAILLDTADSQIQSCISKHLSIYVAKLVGCTSISRFEPYIPDSLPNINLNSLHSYYIFNDSVDSGFFRIRNVDRRSLAAYANSLASEGIKVIRVGSEADRNAFDYLNFDYIDLRGRTTIEELITLFSLPNVIGSVSFDTAIAHISLINKKRAVIRMRRFSVSHEHFIKNCVFPFFEDSNPKIKYI